MCWPGSGRWGRWPTGWPGGSTPAPSTPVARPPNRRAPPRPPPPPRTPPPEGAPAAEPAPPVEQVAGAVFVAKMLADQLHESLGRQGLACIQVLVTAETEHGEIHERRWRHEGSLTAAA